MAAAIYVFREVSASSQLRNLKIYTCSMFSGPTKSNSDILLLLNAKAKISFTAKTATSFTGAISVKYPMTSSNLLLVNYA